jgi:protein-S-isoprenylcysteine O-methyltransferase Ste14
VKTLLLVLRSLLYMAGFLLFFGWIALSLRGLDRRTGITLPASAPIAGLACMALGGVVVAICAGLFILQGRGTPAVFDAPRKFVVLGPYKYVRNPMYIGGLTMLAGLGLYLRSISILALLLVLALAVHLFVLYYEELQLRNKFGAAYIDYCRRVPRWIPGRPSDTP